MSDAATARALGHPITLADGSTAMLRYSFLSILELEEKFGSLVGFQLALEQARRSMEASQAVAKGDATPEQTEQAKQSGALFTVVFDAMSAGLLDHMHQGVYLGRERELCARLMDPSKLQSEYFPAFSKALSEAFGSDDTPGQARPPAQSPEPSPGPSGTTSPPSSADEAMSTSGA